jgi:hypothetical protein
MPAFVRLKQEDYEMEALTLKKVLFLKKKKNPKYVCKKHPRPESNSGGSNISGLTTHPNMPIKETNIGKEQRNSY